MYSVENGIPFATAMFRQSFSTLWVKSQIPVFSGAPFRIATVGVPVDEIVGPDTGGVVGEDVGPVVGDVVVAVALHVGRTISAWSSTVVVVDESIVDHIQKATKWEIGIRYNLFVE